MTPGTLLQGRFEIERAASRGGMGLVFRAHDRLEGRVVAVKVLRRDEPLEVERFERECAVLAALHHPGIVRHLAHGQTPQGERYLVMEWLEGEDLRQRLARRPLTPAESLAVVRNAASALATAHARGLVHRDLKPGNLFLVGGSVERVRVLDFGVARRLDQVEAFTMSGAIIGTPGYMAPEQARGAGDHTARADVFSLGCVLFECLTGHRAFQGADVIALLAKIQLQQAPSLAQYRPDLPEPLARLVAAMMARDPEGRLPDAAAVVTALDAIDGSPALHALAGLPSAGAPPSEGAPAAPPSSVSDLATGAAHVAALGLREQRVVSVVLASAGEAPVDARGEHLSRARARDLAAVSVARHGGHLDVLASGVMLVTIWGAGSAVDRAVRACRSALGLLEHFPGASVCVVTGRGVMSARVLEGGVIDRGALALAATPAGTVHVDAASAEMVAPRFALGEPGPDGARVLGGALGSRDPEQSAAVLLGRPSAFVGRSRELALLEAELAGSGRELSAGAVVVVGEAGSGKSRLGRELLDRIRRAQSPVAVLAGRAESIGERSPYGILADVLRGAAGIHDGEPLEVRRGKLVARLGRHLEGAALGRVSAFLGEMAGTPFPDGAAPPLHAARGNAHLMGDAMRAAWEEWLGHECAQGPVLLLLEDLHWGDAATIKLLDATLRDLRDLPLLVLVLARPEIHARFHPLWPGRGVREIRLAPLPRKASVELVCEALGAGAAVDVVARVVEQAAGNPFYLEELVRAVAAGRGETFPDSVLGTVEARLDAEGVEAKRVLRAASVFGERFSVRGLQALLGGDAEELHERLARLAARELIAEPDERGTGEGAHYTFCHALVREAAYATLTEDDRLLGHRLAGEFLEGSGSTDAVPLAEHFVRGGEPRRAVRWYLRGAEQALAADDLGAAMERVEQGLACGAEGEEQSGLLRASAEGHVWRGELAQAEACAFEASALAAPGSRGWFQGLYQAVVAAGKLGHFDRIEASFASAGATPAAPSAVRARISYLCACASNLIFGGRFAAADAAFTALDALDAPDSGDGRAAPDALSAALMHQARSFRASARGDSGACLAGLTAALAAFEQAGDRRNACMTQVNLGFTRAELGALEGAEEALRAALHTADRLGLHDVTALSRTNLGYVLGCRGEIAEARRIEQQAVEAHARQQATRDEGLGRTYLAQIELRAGDGAAAEREARAAAEVLAVTPGSRAVALAVLARALLAQGRPAEARAAAGEAYACLTHLGSLEEGEALVRLAHAEALAATGETAELASVLAEARDRLLARAALISDPHWRRSFLTGVAENARTLAFAESVLPPR